MKSLLAILIVVGLGPAIMAANVASDNAADPAYSGGWSNGFNGGTGFSPWILTATSPSIFSDGFYIGSSTNNAFGTSPGIDTSGKSWGIYANGGNFTAAYRSFSGGPLSVGQAFLLNMDTGFIDNSNTVGFTIRNGNASSSPSDFNNGSRFEFLFLGGDASNSYKVVDAGGLRNVGVPFTGTGLRLTFLLNVTADSYSLVIVDNASGTTNKIVTGTLGGGGSLDSFALYNRNAGSGGNHDAFFNSVQVGPISEPPSTIDSANAFGFGANTGWDNWQADTTNGVVIGGFVCAGNIFSPNIGWISLGNGHPTNGVHYTNAGANDFGVNNDGQGNLTGYAFNGNVGWLVFSNRDVNGTLYSGPTVNLLNGQLSGYVYGPNTGWINLNTAQGLVRTASIYPGSDADGNGIPDAWELLHFGMTGVNPNADPNHKGMSNLQQYIADTDPSNPNDILRITALSANSSGSTSMVTWTSHATRLYQVEERLDMTAGPWTTNTTLGLIQPDPGSTTKRTVADPAVSKRFYCVQAVLPLSP